MKDIIAAAFSILAFPFRVFPSRGEIELIRMELAEARRDITETKEDVREIRSFLMRG